MNDHYKIKHYSQIVYWFTTGTRTQEYCLEWIKDKFDYLDFYEVWLNGEKIAEKKAVRRRLTTYTWGEKEIYWVGFHQTKTQII